MDACEKNPPANISYKPNRESLYPAIIDARAVLSIPGIGTLPPNLYTNNSNPVKIIFLRKSGILKIFKNLS